jgi:hypothetical protein
VIVLLKLISQVITWIRMRWAGHVAHVAERTNTCYRTLTLSISPCASTNYMCVWIEPSSHTGVRRRFYSHTYYITCYRILVGKPKGRRIILKWVQKKYNCGLYWSGLRQGQVMVCCLHSNAPSGSTKCRECFWLTKEPLATEDSSCIRYMWPC